MIEEIGESIDVVAAFTAGKVLPILFSWKNRRYENLKVASSWSTKDGESKLHHMTVTNDSGNCYELCFSTQNFKWSLIRVHHD